MHVRAARLLLRNHISQPRSSFTANEKRCLNVKHCTKKPTEMRNLNWLTIGTKRSLLLAGLRHPPGKQWHCATLLWTPTATDEQLAFWWHFRLPIFSPISCFLIKDFGKPKYFPISTTCLKVITIQNWTTWKLILLNMYRLMSGYPEKWRFK